MMTPLSCFLLITEIWWGIMGFFAKAFLRMKKVIPFRS